MPSAKTRLYLILVLLAAFCGASLYYFLMWAKEPSYQGKSLSVWLVDLRWAGAAKNDRAVEAIRQIGTNGLPHLLRLLRSHNSSVRRDLRAWLQKLPFLKIAPPSQVDFRWQAACAFKVLGPLAKPAMPELAKLLKRRINPGYVTTALAAVGPDSVPILRETLAGDDHQIRICAATALGTLGPTAREAAPALLKCLDEKIPHFLAIIAQSLAQVDQGQNFAIPALIQRLGSTDVHVRRGAIMALSYYDQPPPATVSSLKQALQDTDQQVREYAAIALKKIAPERPTVAP